MNYTGTTPAGGKVTDHLEVVAGHLEVEDDISYIVQVDADGYEKWYIAHTSSVRKEEGNDE